MSVVPAHPLASAAGPSRAVPPLENGDRLTRAEFERRYAAMPHIQKAELIEGIVYMPSPVRLSKHGKPHVVLSTWLGVYAGRTPGIIDFGDNSTVRLDEDNEPQPDLLMLLPKKTGGGAAVDAEGYVNGPPDLVCEIAASSVSLDLHAKLNAYRRNGVREYLVWRVEDLALDWFVLREGRYEPLRPDGAGFLKSEVFPGFWLDTAALLRQDVTQVRAALEKGLGAPEHAGFVAKLGG